MDIGMAQCHVLADGQLFEPVSAFKILKGKLAKTMRWCMREIRKWRG